MFCIPHPLSFVLRGSSVCVVSSVCLVCQLSQFEFLGQLMGIALRTRLPLGLDLPSTVWKSLLDQPLDVSDLESIDKLCVQALTEIGKLDARSYASMFNEQKFVTQLSDHSEFELRKGGRDTLVSFEAREEFTRLSIDARLQESSKQIASIKKGLHSVVPVSNLALFTSVTQTQHCTAQHGRSCLSYLPCCIC